MYQTQGWQVPQMMGRRPMHPHMMPNGVPQNALYAALMARSPMMNNRILGQGPMPGQMPNALAMGRPFPQFGGYGR